MSSNKRSRKAALIAMVPAGVLLLQGCGEEPQAQAGVFTDTEQCAAYYNPEQCKVEAAKAEALHAQVAPKYQTIGQCEQDFGVGQCEIGKQTESTSTQPAQHAQSGSFFMPMMMGFLAGQMFNQGGRAAPTQPLYRSKDDPNTFRTGSNEPVARNTGVVKVNPERMQTYSAQNVRRGGFGLQAQQRQAQQRSTSSFGG